MDDLCEDERAVELSSIAAIFPEIVIDPKFQFRASLEIPVSPSTPLKVLFQRPQISLPTILDTCNGDNPARDDAEEIQPSSLLHLPPLRLEIGLPDGYPASKPPNISITTNPNWLPPSKVAELITDSNRLWEECGRGLVIFAFIDHLQQLAERSFDLSADPKEPLVLSRDLKVALMDFDMKTEREKFEQGTFECGVCLEPKKGTVCHRMLLCSHVFCVPCLQGFYNSCIKEGDVTSVKCLAPDCGKNPKEAQDGAGEATDPRHHKKKKDRTLNPSELLQIPLDREVVQRYVHLKRKRKLESDRTTVYCPRQWCQGAARSKRHPKPEDPINGDPDLSDDEDDENIPAPFDPLGAQDQLPPMSQRLAVCEDCSYAFCCVCKKGWHGELAYCYPRGETERSAADKASEAYIQKYTAPCPTCDARCQKAMGCNHMICFKCNTHFCYLCSSWLFESNPYSHFNDPDSKCYMRLWELEEGDDSGPNNNLNWDRVAAQMAAEMDDSDDEAGDLEREIAAETGNNGVRANNRGPAQNNNHQQRQHPPPAPVPPNAARHRGNNRAPPPAPAPPGGNAQNGRHLDDAARAAAAERQVQVQAMAEARGQQQNAPNAQPPGQLAGLQRFLQLVQNDQEDEWDSDELEDF
ncbi:hypothetical protein AJ79_09301 [Helicocarpus griseus UAMH5409]|uniref:RBR-type E3 ubiquitin transferase n=1 Tax=Helicocarpus griseus UAMH5409 TaxID=1447875 RepID=A0A2B7WKZ9_9EURO|nr:hypothetical protein AJ79_09301 [Helicocarpus griseus UAMH5409]